MKIVLFPAAATPTALLRPAERMVPPVIASAPLLTATPAHVALGQLAPSDTPMSTRPPVMVTVPPFRSTTPAAPLFAARSVPPKIFTLVDGPPRPVGEPAA